MSTFEPREVFILFGGGGVVLGLFIWIGVGLYMANTQLDLMLGHLKNCPSVNRLVSLKHGGLWGKLLLVGSISGVVTFPGFYLKRGEVIDADLTQFPEQLKRKLILFQWVGIVLLSSLFLMWGVAKTIGWL